LFFDISTLMNEALSQAEYMNETSPDSSVHFEMTGFSDRLIGKPTGLLLLIHDRNPKLPQGEIQEAVRKGIEYAIGDLGNPKEYFTAADYGPTSYVTMAMQKAPAANISIHYKNAMFHRIHGLGSKEPDYYQDETMLHPYIFLYNLLWLAVRINKWTYKGNTEFIRQFQIPTRVIEKHYQNPSRIPDVVGRVESDTSYTNSNVSIPSDDKRDLQNAMKSDRKLLGTRNIVPLIGIMALRHEKAGELEDEKLWSDDITDKEYKVLKDKLKTDAYDLCDREYLDPKASSEGVTDAAPKSKIAARLAKLREGKERNIAKDDLKTRTKAWFKAYSEWLKFTDEGRKPTAIIEDQLDTLLGEDES